jgi:hypothetical protein
MQRPSASIRSAHYRALSTSFLATFTCSVAMLPAEPELASRLRRILVDDGIEHVDARAVAVDQIVYRRGCWRERSSRRVIRFSKWMSSVGRPGWPPGVGR